MRGNFLDVPTDCPQRDERLGWTGDIQVFAPTASFLYDSAGFLASWLADLAAEQQEDGSVPFVVPDVLQDARPGRRGVGRRRGDRAVGALPAHRRRRACSRRQLPSMRAWVDQIAELAGADRLWTGGFQFGDWLDPTAPPDQPVRGARPTRTWSPPPTSPARPSSSPRPRRCSAMPTRRPRVRATWPPRCAQAFAAEYVTAGGRVLSDAPTGYALALEWALLPTPSSASGPARLADLVRTRLPHRHRLRRHAADLRRADRRPARSTLAYRLLLQSGCPSWLYPVTMGATTIWERWDSMLPDGRINPGEMTSFNHYALGAVADWLHRTVAGLAPAAPGYRGSLVRPRPAAA